MKGRARALNLSVTTSRAQSAPQYCLVSFSVSQLPEVSQRLSAPKENSSSPA